VFLKRMSGDRATIELSRVSADVPCDAQRNTDENKAIASIPAASRARPFGISADVVKKK